MQLLDNEKIIASTNKGLLVLTNFRIIQQAKAENSKLFKSIYLTDITSVAITRKRIELLLYLALFALVNGMASLIGERIVEGVMGHKGGSLALTIGAASLFFYLLYSFYTIRVISIATASLKVEQQTSTKDDIRGFIFKVEKARFAARATALQHRAP